jgi:hypothetical protein
MFNPIKTIKSEITGTRTNIREFIAAYKHEKEIQTSIAKLEETKLVPGYTNVYA